MKRNLKKKGLICVGLSALFVAATTLGGCGGSEVTKPEPETPVTITYRDGYTPELFDNAVTYTGSRLCDGVTLVANTLTLKSTEEGKEGHTVVVYTVEVDLSKVDIRAGTRNNETEKFTFQKAVPWQHATAWEKQTGGKVYATVNADFFGTQCVNAFVKDGYIIKTGHNDNGNYDYKNESSDVPASAPMLFGIKGETAQIAPIISYEGDVTTPEVKEKLVAAKLSYVCKIEGKEGEIAVTPNVAPTKDAFTFNTTRESYVSDAIAVKVDVSGGYKNMAVLEKSVVTARTQFTPDEGKTAYLIAVQENAAAYGFLNGISEGDRVSLSVASPDGKWNGYETILGCRQALVIDDAIASTVTLENTNGAQTTDIPRTCVGIKPDGTVVIFAMESMYYYDYKYHQAKEGDPHGMSLPEIAEFIYFYGCNQAANFDGGGSTQLIVRGEKDTAARVLVRSADTSSYELLKTRSVMNSLMVTSKVN